jgi:D-inositol-3-phosphate glycosyltransferase
VLHGNYWLSGAVAHRLKHALDVPLVATFHTLARVKADAGVDDDPEHRSQVEHEVIACADLVLASTEEEREQLADHYDADPQRIEIVPPGVDHRVFAPADRGGARAALGLDGEPLLLFVGRIQPLKGVDLAVRCLATLDDPRSTLLVVGGPSGPDGDDELARVHALASELGVAPRVRFVDPQPHTRLVDYYRAADVCLVPSRSESFGLVALEAAACGTPVVAAAVGGLRSLVDDARTGFLVEGRDPADFAAPVSVLLEDRALAASIGANAAARSRGYSWSITAARLRRLYGDLVARGLVSCR